MSLSTSAVRAEAKARGYSGASSAGGSTSRERRDAENFGCAMHLLEMERKEKTELQEKVQSLEKERDIAKETTRKVEKMLFQERKDTSKLRDQVAELRRELSSRQDRHKLEMEKGAQAPAALTSQLEHMTTNWQWEKNRRQNQHCQIAELQHKLSQAEGQLKGQQLEAKKRLEEKEKNGKDNVETIARVLARERADWKIKDEELAQLRRKEEKKKMKKMEKKGTKDWLNFSSKRTPTHIELLRNLTLTSSFLSVQFNQFAI